MVFFIQIISYEDNYQLLVNKKLILKYVGLPTALNSEQKPRESSCTLQIEFHILNDLFDLFLDLSVT